MICVITGYPMFNKPPSPGLKEIAVELSKRHKKTKVLQLKWNQTPTDDQLGPFNEPILLIGHSFGGCSAVMISRHLEGLSTDVHLLLIDPVRHQVNDRRYPIPKRDLPGAQIGGKQFDPGRNWKSALAFLRTDATWLPPYHQGLGKSLVDTNMQVMGTDHNTIIESMTVQSMIYANAATLFD
jgi:hypothetical protein